ncbi:MAG: ferric reductase-like transmembrane domain-containing protein [Gemmatimonadaceae bacterium]|nr:ferric reductase-like transmembrane domain-containing protein [Gemmatimonadaceae bacterium]
MSHSQRRFIRHLMIAAAAIAISAAIWMLRGSRSAVENASTATAYAGIAFLALSLALGPRNLLRSRPNPVSTDLRRDIGIWAGSMGVLHTILGLQVHMGGSLRRYFLPSAAAEGEASAATLAFVAANYMGLVAALLLVILLAISSDVALRALGVPAWKRIQRSNYFIIALVAVHGVFYQLLEKRRPELVMLFGAMLAAVLVFQVAGVRRRRQMAGSRVATPASPE